MKSMLGALLILVFGVFGYVAYSGYRARQSTFGDVSAGSADRPNRDETASRPTPASQVPVPGDSHDTSSGAASSGSSAPSPTTDTIAPNPPNGMIFSGSGHFQLYRQGDLTWRLNTTTGETCIIFATTEEWREPRVRRAACPKAPH